MRRKNKKDKINTAKLGVMFIVTVMALAAIGAGYSAWFDTITIEGSVSTGSVEWEIVDYSSTFVYKIWDCDNPEMTPENEILIDYDHATEGDSEDYVHRTFMGEHCGIEHIASAVAKPHPGGEYDVLVEFNNLFPCIWFKADIVIEYTGSVPGKINDIYYEATGGIDWITPLIASSDIYATARCDGEVVELGYQLHEGDEIHIELWVHIPQNNDLMLKEAAFTASFEVVQWNEYPYEGGDCGDEPSIGHHADVMLCIDRSGSIQTAGAETTVQDAAKAFVTAILSPDDGQIGLVSFATSATLDSSFSTNIPALHGIIDGLSFAGSTDIAGAIFIAQNELDNNDRIPDATYKDYMVIITDGIQTVAGDPVSEATTAKAAGTRIFVLGVGGVDSTTLEDIASPGDYYPVADFDDLETVLLSLI